MAQEAASGGGDPVRDVDELEDLLSEPADHVVETMARLEGDVMVLGAGGKMGPTLARMAKRASDAAGVQRRVIGVSRFSTEGARARLERHGVEAVPCDLHNELQLASLPKAPNIVYMVGMKFGSTGQEALTWATNAYLPGLVSRTFSASRIVAFSTGNVYGLTPVEGGGSREGDALDPDGEYAMSCLGRERVLEHFSRACGTRMAIVRLNYATELRYGVLVDLAERVLGSETVDLAMGHFNAIWQADANAMALSCFQHVSSPPFTVNVTGPEVLSVRRVCEELGRLMDREPAFSGTESPSALLSRADRAFGLFGRPRIDADRMVRLVADWMMRGGERLGKPTHFEARDGRY